MASRYKFSKEEIEEIVTTRKANKEKRAVFAGIRVPAVTVPDALRTEDTVIGDDMI